MDYQTIPAAADAAPAAPRLTMRLVLREVAGRLFDVESGWLRTARELTLGPGPMIRRYVQGHRKVYANPFGYLVAATDYEVIPVIEKLLDEGADVNMTLQRTALHAAAENGNLEIVGLLIGHGADVNLKDIHGRVPMFVALVEDQPEIARRLVEAETDASISAADGSTLLMAALRAEDVKLVRWALDHGADVNATRPAKDHATALMIAAGDGNLEMVDLLLTRGADPDVANHEGETALDLAKGREVEDLLRARTVRAPSSPPAVAETDDG
ncbi:MAG: ankyrin repeat domain-containing protein [Thermoanaerobaculales bacterium]